MATAKHKFQKLVFHPANQKLVDFPDGLQKLAKNAFGIVAHAIIGQFSSAKMHQVHLENGTHEQIVTHLESELELNGLEAPDELQINTVSHNTANTIADRAKPTCHLCQKNQDITKISAVCQKRKKSSLKILKMILESKTVAPTPLSQTTIQTKIITKTTTKTVIELKESQKLFIHPVRYVGRQTTPQRNATMEPMQQIERLPSTEDLNNFHR